MSLPKAVKITKNGVEIISNVDRIQYTLNAQMQTETYRNALRRFAMLSLNYNITKQPKKR